MKKFLVLILVLCPILAFGQYVNPTPDYQFKGQVSVGTDTDAYVPSLSSSWLTVGPDSTNKGLILPRVVDTSDVSNPTDGMVVYQKSDNSIYKHSPTGWTLVGSGSAIIDTVSNIISLESYENNSSLIYVTDSLRGGLFYLSNVGVPDSGLIFPSSFGGKVWRRDFQGRTVNILWYGAKNDMSESAVPAIQQAMNTLQGYFADITGNPGGGTIFFPAGNYLIDTTIVLRSKVSMSGDFWSVLIESSNFTGDMFHASDTGLNYVQYSDLSFRGNNSLSTVGGDCFHFTVPTNSKTISDIHFMNLLIAHFGGNGIYLETGWQYYLSGNTIETNNGYPIRINPQGTATSGNIRRVSIIGNYIYGNSTTHDIISVTADSISRPASGILIANNRLQTSGAVSQNGISLYGVTDFTITGNRIGLTPTSADSAENTISQIYIDSTSSEGNISANTLGGLYNEISINPRPKYGISILNGSNHINVSGNLITNVKQPINVDSDSYDLTIEDGNRFYTNVYANKTPTGSLVDSILTKGTDSIVNAISANSFIQNQTTSKQTANSRYVKSIVDTVTTQLVPSYPFDFRSGTNLLQWDGNRLILDNGSGGINIGTFSGSNNESGSNNTYIGKFAGLDGGAKSVNNTFVGSRSGEYINGNSNTALGLNSAYTFNGGSSVFLGMRSGIYTNGNGLSFLGYEAGYMAYSDSSTYVGTLSGQTQDVSFIADSSTMANVTHGKTFGISFSGHDIDSLIYSNSLGVDSTYPFHLTFSAPYPKDALDSDILNLSGKMYIASSDSILTIGTTQFKDTGSTSFSLFLTTRKLVNSQVFGSGAMSDSSNQVVLGNDRINQIKFGGSGNVRLATNISPSDGSTLKWDSSSGEYKPSISTVFGSSSQSGDGTTTAFTIPISPGFTPGQVLITPTSEDAAKAVFYVSAKTSTSFTVTSTGTTPPSGTNNVAFDYELIK